VARFLHFGELGRGPPGHLGHPELGQLVLQVVQLLEQLLLLLAPQISSLDLGLDTTERCQRDSRASG